MEQSHPAAMPMRSSILNNNKNDHNSNSNDRGVHPNINLNDGGHDSGAGVGGGGIDRIGIFSRSRLSSSDQFLLRSQDDLDNCKHHIFTFLIYYYLFIFLIIFYYFFRFKLFFILYTKRDFFN